MFRVTQKLHQAVYMMAKANATVILNSVICKDAVSTILEEFKAF